MSLRVLCAEIVPVHATSEGLRSATCARRRRVVAAALVIAVVLVATGPPLYGARPLADRAEIRRDTFGVPHIVAEDEEAGGFAFGYAMAEDHAAEIGRRYLQARGEAARHFGPGEVDADLAIRRFDNRAAARRALADEIGRRFRRWLQGFAAGINAYVADHRESVPAVDAGRRAVRSAGVWPHVRSACGVTPLEPARSEVRRAYRR